MEAWIALIGAVFGGAGLKLVEHLVNRSKLRIDAAADIREELREEINSLRKEVRVLSSDLDEWKNKYYLLLERFNRMKIEHQISDFPFEEKDRK